jgi:hypothetical protein
LLLKSRFGLERSGHNNLSGLTVYKTTDMRPIIDIFKTEFLNYAGLLRQLGLSGYEMKESEFYYSYSPSLGELSKVLTVLKRNKVAHAIHFNNAEAAGHPMAHSNEYQSALLC